MSDRIIIDFDDEEKKPDFTKEPERIIIDLSETDEAGTGEADAEMIEKKEIIEVTPEESIEDKILNSKINSFYKGSPGLEGFYDASMNFPEGIDQGFRRIFNKKLKEEFFNSILESNRHVILCSKSGNVYLIDRFTGDVKDMLFFENETFEKTGLVKDNIAYVNSLSKIHRIDSSTGKISSTDIYSSVHGSYIWSNLNYHDGRIIFAEYDPAQRKGSIKQISFTGEASGELEFIADSVSDKICVAEGYAYLITGDSMIVFDIAQCSGSAEKLNIEADENSFIFYLNHRVYITTINNELYYLDLPAENHKFRNTGIRNNFINSIGGFGDNIFAGTLDGWRFYKSSGLQVYNHEDEYENKVECISRNILAVSQKNKIVFCNLNRFQEAEGYVIATDDRNDSVEIVSAIFSFDTVYVLTRNGIIEAFATDKLNIHI